MTDKAEKLIEICTKLLETAGVLEIVDLQLDTVNSSERVGHPSEGYAFTGYGQVTLKVMFAPPDVKEFKSEAKRIEAANTIEVKATEANHQEPTEAQAEPQFKFVKLPSGEGRPFGPWVKDFKEA